MRTVKSSAKAIARHLQRTNKDQYLLTIPKTLVTLLEWNDKDEIVFTLEKNALKIVRKK